MKIHADPITVNCKKVLAGLQLMGAPYELVHVDYFKGEQKLEPFVSRINQLVLVMERSYADDTNLLRSVQAGLVLLAILGTVVLIRFFIQLVIRPVTVLHSGMQRMIDNDLAVRLPVGGDDAVGRGRGAG